MTPSGPSTMATIILAMALLTLAAAVPPPPPPPVGGLASFAGLASMPDLDDDLPSLSEEAALQAGGVDGADGEDTERQSVLWRAKLRRLAPPPAADPALGGHGGLRELLGRMRVSSPRKSAQFTPAGVLAEGGDSEDMISDPGPALGAQAAQRAQHDAEPLGTLASSVAGSPGVPRYPSSGVTREVHVRQGRLVGVVRAVPGFGEVHQFLGLPYAEPPVGSQRFMPPASPSQWKGLKIADRFGHVCPQVLPDLTLHNVSAGRLSHVQRLLPYLQDQSEDCLYLNVYAPAQASSRSSRLPVMVYIHGESLEWNAGTPYDGSVLAAYGKVIVVTFNFRLGILGFLRPGVHDNTVSNFGLLDQVAALQWVKDNIEALGGDPQSVTLMGHSTGAACASLLLVSPVSSNLFKRAILMSGTALADWALTPSPLQFTIQVAEGLNCPLSDELPQCLRKKRLSDLLAVRLTRPPFKTAFGPVVDGSVIPNEPLHLMGTYRELFSRYELMLGVTELEAYHLLDSKSLSFGVLERDRDAMLKRYTRARFEKHPDVALARTLAEYAQDAALLHPVPAEGQRDLLLDILSDARVAAPVVRTAELHADANRSSFLYVFTHRTKASNYPAVDKSVQGDELAYVFGLPLAPTAVRPGRHFTFDEKRLSEQVITFWTNFAKTGNPNVPRTQARLYWPEYSSREMPYLNISIPSSVDYRYRAQQMKYWNHDLPELLRNPQPSPWSEGEDGEEGDSGNPGSAFGVSSMYPARSRDPYAQEEDGPRPQVYGTLVHVGQGDTPHQRPILSLGPSPPRRAELGLTVEGPDGDLQTNPGESLGGLGGPDGLDGGGESGLARVAPSTLALSVVIVVGISFLLVNMCAFGFLYYKKNRLRVQQQFFSSQCRGGGLDEDVDGAYTKKLPATASGAFGCATSSLPPPASQCSQPPLPLTPPQQQQQQQRLGVGQRLRLLLNRAGSGPSRRLHRQARGAGVGAPSATSVPPSRGRADSKDDLYEAVRCASRSASRMGRARPSAASSTASASAPSRGDGDDRSTPSRAEAVRDWVAMEVVQRCSPAFLRRGRRASVKSPLCKSSSLDQTDQAHQATATAGSAGASPRPAGPPKSAVQKVSVAIDATPGARGSSVLRQMPIELSKSLEETTRCEAESAGPAAPSSSATPSLTRSTPALPALCSRLSEASPADEVDGPVTLSERRRSTASIHLDLQPSVVDIVVPASSPSAPSSPSVPMRSFGAVDVNVTSRDEALGPQAAQGLGPEEALDTMRRRNYPKVLPDCSPQQLSAMQLAAARRRSLPPGQLQHLQLLRAGPAYPSLYPSLAEVEPTGFVDSGIPGRARPAPPPRISSTLGRHPTRAAGPTQQAGVRVVLPAGPLSAASSTASTATPTVRFEPRVVIRAREPSEDDGDGPAPTPSTPASPAFPRTSSSTVTLRRPEPRVIIKASSTNPVRPTGSADDDYGFARSTKPHPVVNLQQDQPVTSPLAGGYGQDHGQGYGPCTDAASQRVPCPSTALASVPAAPTTVPVEVTLTGTVGGKPTVSPAIAPKPVLKKSVAIEGKDQPTSKTPTNPQLCDGDLLQSGSKPTSTQPPLMSPQQSERKVLADQVSQPRPPPSPKDPTQQGAGMAPPTPPPMPINGTSKQQKQHGRKGSEGGATHPGNSQSGKVGTNKKGRKK